MNNRTAWLAATWLGCGRAPLAPGTVGSLGALLPVWIALELTLWPPWVLLILVAVALFPAIRAAGAVAAAMNIKDPGVIVIDEVLGQWVALAGALRVNAKSVIAAFLLFRLFDIWKPPPVRRLEALAGGTGIVADDLMAGGYAALVLLLAGCFNLY
jgi:phosphatidylglycerophosphatase A